MAVVTSDELLAMCLYLLNMIIPHCLQEKEVFPGFWAVLWQSSL